MLLIDPYANQHLNRLDIRTVNQVADLMVDSNEDTDPHEIALAIRAVYRPGMAAEPLLIHATRTLRAIEKRRSSSHRS